MSSIPISEEVDLRDVVTGEPELINQVAFGDLPDVQNGSIAFMHHACGIIVGAGQPGEQLNQFSPFMVCFSPNMVCSNFILNGTYVSLQRFGGPLILPHACAVLADRLHNVTYAPFLMCHLHESDVGIYKFEPGTNVTELHYGATGPGANQIVQDLANGWRDDMGAGEALQLMHKTMTEAMGGEGPVPTANPQ